MVLLVIWYCLSLLINKNPCPHISQTNFSCLCRYLFFSNEVCVLNPLPQSLQNLCWPCIIYFRSSLCEIFLLWSLVEPCLWHVLDISVLSSVVSSKVSDVPTIFCCFVLSFWFVQKGVVTIIFKNDYSSIFTFESFLKFGLCEFWTWTSCILVSFTFQRIFFTWLLYDQISEIVCFWSSVLAMFLLCSLVNNLTTIHSDEDDWHSFFSTI